MKLLKNIITRSTIRISTEELVEILKTKSPITGDATPHVELLFDDNKVCSAIDFTFTHVKCDPDITFPIGDK